MHEVCLSSFLTKAAVSTWMRKDTCSLVSWHLQEKKLPKTCIWKNLFVPDEVFTPDETEVLIQQCGWDASYKPLGYIPPSKPTLLALEITNSHNAEIFFSSLDHLDQKFENLSISYNIHSPHPTPCGILMVLTWWSFPSNLVGAAFHSFQISSLEKQR